MSEDIDLKLVPDAATKLLSNSAQRTLRKSIHLNITNQILDSGLFTQSQDPVVRNESVVHGLVLDQSVNVAPRSTSDVALTVLHLSTVGSIEKESCTNGLNVLGNSVKALCGNNCAELYHVAFSYDVGGEKNIWDSSRLHVCRPSREGTLTLDNSFREAKCLFDDICPNMAFLRLSREMDDFLKERQAGMNDNCDEEVQILGSAMQMVKTSDEV
jgi:hypothetical protein